MPVEKGWGGADEEKKIIANVIQKAVATAPTQEDVNEFESPAFRQVVKQVVAAKAPVAKKATAQLPDTYYAAKAAAAVAPKPVVTPYVAPPKAAYVGTTQLPDTQAAIQAYTGLPQTIKPYVAPVPQAVIPVRPEYQALYQAKRAAQEAAAPVVPYVAPPITEWSDVLGFARIDPNQPPPTTMGEMKARQAEANLTTPNPLRQRIYEGMQGWANRFIEPIERDYGPGWTWIGPDLPPPTTTAEMQQRQQAAIHSRAFTPLLAPDLMYRAGRALVGSPIQAETLQDIWPAIKSGVSAFAQELRDPLRATREFMAAPTPVEQKLQQVWGTTMSEASSRFGFSKPFVSEYGPLGRNTLAAGLLREAEMIPYYRIPWAITRGVENLIAGMPEAAQPIATGLMHTVWPFTGMTPAKKAAKVTPDLVGQWLRSADIAVSLLSPMQAAEPGFSQLGKGINVPAEAWAALQPQERIAALANQYEPRYQGFQKDIDAGMDLNEAMNKYRNVVPEVISSLITRPLLPRAATAAIVGTALAPYQIGIDALRGIGKVAGKTTIGKLLAKPATSWAVEQHVRPIQDSLGTAFASNSTDTPVVTLGKIMVGDSNLFGKLPDPVVDVLKKYGADLKDYPKIASIADEGASTAERVLDWAVGTFGPEGKLAEELSGEELAEVFAKAEKVRAYRALGIDVDRPIATGVEMITSLFGFGHGVLKEAWLSTTGYMSRNFLDNLVKAADAGYLRYFPDLLDSANKWKEYHVQMTGEYGEAVPRMVGQGLTAAEVGTPKLSHVARIPIPLIGTPQGIDQSVYKVTQAIGNLLKPLGIDTKPFSISGTAKKVQGWLGKKLDLPAEDLGKAPSPAAEFAGKVADNFNLATLMDKVREPSNTIEAMANTGTFMRKFLTALDGSGPGTGRRTTFALGMNELLRRNGVNEDVAALITQDIMDAAKVKSVDDIDAILRARLAQRQRIPIMSFVDPQAIASDAYDEFRSALTRAEIVGKLDTAELDRITQAYLRQVETDFNAAQAQKVKAGKKAGEKVEPNEFIPAAKPGLGEQAAEMAAERATWKPFDASIESADYHRTNLKTAINRVESGKAASISEATGDSFIATVKDIPDAKKLLAMTDGELVSTLAERYNVATGAKYEVAIPLTKPTGMEEVEKVADQQFREAMRAGKTEPEAAQPPAPEAVAPMPEAVVAPKTATWQTLEVLDYQRRMMDLRRGGDITANDKTRFTEALKNMQQGKNLTENQLAALRKVAGKLGDTPEGIAAKVTGVPEVVTPPKAPEVPAAEVQAGVTKALEAGGEQDFVDRWNLYRNKVEDSRKNLEAHAAAKAATMVMQQGQGILETWQNRVAQVEYEFNQRFGKPIAAVAPEVPTAVKADSAAISAAMKQTGVDVTPQEVEAARKAVVEEAPVRSIEQMQASRIEEYDRLQEMRRSNAKDNVLRDQQRFLDEIDATIKAAKAAAEPAPAAATKAAEARYAVNNAGMRRGYYKIEDTTTGMAVETGATRSILQARADQLNADYQRTGLERGISGAVPAEIPAPIVAAAPVAAKVTTPADFTKWVYDQDVPAPAAQAMLKYRDALADMLKGKKGALEAATKARDAFLGEMNVAPKVRDLIESAEFKATLPPEGETWKVTSGHLKEDNAFEKLVAKAELPDKVLSELTLYRERVMAGWSEESVTATRASLLSVASQADPKYMGAMSLLGSPEMLASLPKTKGVAAALRPTIHVTKLPSGELTGYPVQMGITAGKMTPVELDVMTWLPKVQQGDLNSVRQVLLGDTAENVIARLRAATSAEEVSAIWRDTAAIWGITAEVLKKQLPELEPELTAKIAQVSQAVKSDAALQDMLGTAKKAVADDTKAANKLADLASNDEYAAAAISKGVQQVVEKFQGKDITGFEPYGTRGFAYAPEGVQVGYGGPEAGTPQVPRAVEMGAQWPTTLAEAKAFAKSSGYYQAEVDELASRYSDVTSQINRMRDHVAAQIGQETPEILQTRASSAALAKTIPEAVKGWANLLWDTSQKAAKDTKDLFVDYMITSTGDKILGTMVPFYKWQRANVPIYVDILKRQPQLALAADKYTQYTEEQRKQAGLTQRFQGMILLKQDDGSYVAVDFLNGLLSFVPTVLNVGEEESAEITAGMSPMQKAIHNAVKAWQTFGGNFWPEAEMGLRAMGVYGKWPARDLLPITKIVRMVSGVDIEQPIRGLMNKVGHTSDWLLDYWTRETLAEMVDLGDITLDESSRVKAAMSGDLWDQARAIAQMRIDGSGTVSMFVPARAKYAAAAEVSMRNKQEQYYALKTSEEKKTFLANNPGLVSYWETFHPEDIESNIKSREYTTQRDKLVAEQNAKIDALEAKGAGEHALKVVESEYGKKLGELSKKYEDVFKTWGTQEPEAVVADVTQAMRNAGDYAAASSFEQVFKPGIAPPGAARAEKEFEMPGAQIGMVDSESLAGYRTRNDDPVQAVRRVLRDEFYSPAWDVVASKDPAVTQKMKNDAKIAVNSVDKEALVRRVIELHPEWAADSAAIQQMLEWTLPTFEQMSRANDTPFGAMKGELVNAFYTLSDGTRRSSASQYKLQELWGKDYEHIFDKDNTWLSENEAWMKEKLTQVGRLDGLIQEGFTELGAPTGQVTEPTSIAATLKEAYAAAAASAAKALAREKFGEDFVAAYDREKYPGKEYDALKAYMKQVRSQLGLGTYDEARGSYNITTVPSWFESGMTGKEVAEQFKGGAKITPAPITTTAGGTTKAATTKKAAAKKTTYKTTKINTGTRYTSTGTKTTTGTATTPAEVAAAATGPLTWTTLREVGGQDIARALAKVWVGRGDLSTDAQKWLEDVRTKTNSGTDTASWIESMRQEFLLAPYSIGPYVAEEGEVAEITEYGKSISWSQMRKRASPLLYVELDEFFATGTPLSVECREFLESQGGDIAGTQGLVPWLARMFMGWVATVKALGQQDTVDPGSFTAGSTWATAQAWVKKLLELTPQITLEEQAMLT